MHADNGLVIPPLWWDYTALRRGRSARAQPRGSKEGHSVYTGRNETQRALQSEDVPYMEGGAGSVRAVAKEPSDYRGGTEATTIDRCVADSVCRWRAGSAGGKKVYRCSSPSSSTLTETRAATRRIPRAFTRKDWPHWRTSAGTNCPKPAPIPPAPAPGMTLPAPRTVTSAPGHLMSRW